MMHAYRDFRLFYNQSIHPELMNMERRRIRLLRLLAFSGILALLILLVQILLGIFLVTLLLLIPLGILAAYLWFRIQLFYQEFKPRIMELLLDFIDNDINFGKFEYRAKGFIDKKQFLASRIFTRADDYAGEDLIKGQVRETPFAFSELRVYQISPVRSKLDRVFKGIFLVGDFRRPDMRGGVLILPDAYRKYLLQSTKNFHLAGGRRVRQNLSLSFERVFDTYATPVSRITTILSADMQAAILAFRERFQAHNRQKEIYLSMIGDQIYIALTQDRDLLEPQLFRSNVSFELIKEYYEDICMLLDIVRDVDVMN